MGGADWGVIGVEADDEDEESGAEGVEGEEEEGEEGEFLWFLGLLPVKGLEEPRMDEDEGGEDEEEDSWGLNFFCLSLIYFGGLILFCFFSVTSEEGALGVAEVSDTEIAVLLVSAEEWEESVDLGLYLLGLYFTALDEGDVELIPVDLHNIQNIIITEAD